MNETSIEVASEPTVELVEALQRLLPQLQANRTNTTQTTVATMMAQPGNRLLIARSEGVIAGVLTLVVVIRVDGNIVAQIEDVVVDEQYRRRGLGEKLVERAEELARNQGANAIVLTSRPSRVAAHALYAAAGFTDANTTVFKKVL